MGLLLLSFIDRVSSSTTTVVSVFVRRDKCCGSPFVRFCDDYLVDSFEVDYLLHFYNLYNVSRYINYYRKHYYMYFLELLLTCLGSRKICLDDIYFCHWTDYAREVQLGSAGTFPTTGECGPTNTQCVNAKVSKSIPSISPGSNQFTDDPQCFFS